MLKSVCCNNWTAWVEGSHGEKVHGMASVGPVTLTKTIKLYSRLDNFDYILRAWNRMEKSTLLQREPGWNRHVQRWVTLVERESSIFSVKQRDTACSRLNHAVLSNSAVHTNGAPLSYIRSQTSLFLLMTRLYSDIYDTFITN